MTQGKKPLIQLLSLREKLCPEISPEEAFSTVVDYLKQLDDSVRIESIYDDPYGDGLIHFDDKKERNRLNMDDFENLLKQEGRTAAVILSQPEIQRLSPGWDGSVSAFPIFIHRRSYGYLLIYLEKNQSMPPSQLSLMDTACFLLATYFLAVHTGLKNRLMLNELIELETELEEIRKHLIDYQKRAISKELMPVIFHKLKNKLTPVLGYSQMLMSQEMDEKTSRRVQKIEKCALDLTDQLSQLREYFEEDAVIKEKVHLNEIIMNVKSYLIDIEHNEGIDVRLKLDTGVPDDSMIAGQIESLLINLIENAVLGIIQKRTSGGFINIETLKKDDDHYQFTIEDNGIGIEEENLDKIWSPFYSTFPHRPGLGLSVCNKILMSHGATCEIESRPNEGTKVWVQFVRCDQDASQVKPAQGEVRRDTRKVLLIGRRNRMELLTDIIRSINGVDLDTAEDWNSGISHMKGKTYDMIVLDSQVPGMSIAEILDLETIENKRNIVLLAPPMLPEDELELEVHKRVEIIRRPFRLMDFRRLMKIKLS